MDQTSDEAQRAFISIAAHELRAPLSIIKSVIENLVGQVLGPLSPEQKKAIEIVERQTERLIQLTKKLLDISRLESGKLAVNLLPHEPIELVRRFLESGVQNPLPSTIDIRNKVADDLPMVRADEVLIGEVFANLWSNALRHTHSVVEFDAKLVRDKDPNLVEFSVSNDGPHIPDEQLERLFHRFGRIDDPGLTPSYQGTGLGLSICKEIIHLHGGNISVKSVPMGMTRFFFSLPVATS